jgi:DNA-binding CsgD family transcriptional regulator
MLNEREIETLTLVARGKTSAQIADMLGLAKRTIDFHIDNARAKLGAATRTQAVAKATTERLIKPSSWLFSAGGAKGGIGDEFATRASALAGHTRSRARGG